MILPTIDEVRQNLSSVASQLAKETGDSIWSKVQLLNDQRLLLQWVLVHGDIFFRKLVTEQEIKLVEPFFRLCEEKGIKLTDKDKQAIFENCFPATPTPPRRRRLPDERQSITHKFSIAGHEGYITVGTFEDGMPGEVFIMMSREGSAISGLMDAFAKSISLLLQYGVPLKLLVEKFRGMRFEPSGFTNNPEIPIAKSISDYIFRWLGIKYLPNEDAPVKEPLQVLATGARVVAHTADSITLETKADGPPCHADPGHGPMVRGKNGLYKCLQCGATPQDDTGGQKGGPSE